MAPIVAIFARLGPRKPRSRTVVTPASMVDRIAAAILSTRIGGGWTSSIGTFRPPPGSAKCTCVSMNPGRMVPGSAIRRQSPGASHDIDTVALRQHDFGAVFDARYERLIRQIEDATGRPVNRGDGQRSPFAPEQGGAASARGIQSLIEGGESKVVEFKATGRKNLATGQKDPAMEWAVVKTIAGFMNGHGGTLLVGVEDDGSVPGLEEDFSVLSKKNTDGWELWLTDLLIQVFGKAATANVTVAFGTLEERKVARIDVAPATEPIYTHRTKTGAKGAVFLVRLNNTTHELDGPDAYAYQHNRWFK